MAEDEPRQIGELEEELKPTGDDLRSEDRQYNPAIEPEKAEVWLNMLRESEKAFETWNDTCDNIEKLYANLEQLRNQTRDKQFNLFWANLEILKPSIYAKPPVPVVVPKFKDRRPLYQVTSELLERCSIVAFDLTRINDLLLLVRDDLATTGRGVAWCRYEPAEPEEEEAEYVCVDFKGRRDFLHGLARNWREMPWVAGASYMTRPQAAQRFRPYSKDEYQKLEYKVVKDSQEIGGADNRERAKIWELWHRPLNKVIWVGEGCENVLDSTDDPKELADLQNFFPCPKPAYSAVQPGSLIPVPDVLQYKDQLDEVNTLTARIHALSSALEVKGFYPAGSAELADAVESAVKIKSNSRVLVPISNWAAFGGSKEVVIWLPIDMIANTITALIAVRKQVIEDIYQIMGLSDIMRGATDPNETLGAQQIKAQYGSVRIRDKQGEMVRIARDVEEILAEIMCSDFSFDTMLYMSQMEIPTTAEQQQKIMAMQQQLAQMAQQVQQMQQIQQMNPQAQAMTQQNPQQANQMQHQFMTLQQNLQDEMQKPTAEQVAKFIKDYRTTTMILDIETDSTIQADENAEKQRRGEFMGMMSALLPQLAQLVAAEPGAAEFCGELLKFSVAPFRVGRTLDGSIDNLVEQIEMKSAQLQGSPKETADQQKITADTQIKMKQIEADQAQAQMANNLEMTKIQNDNAITQQQMQNDFNIAMFEAQSRRDTEMAKQQQIQQKGRIDAALGEQRIREGNQKVVLNTQMAQQKQADAQQRRFDAQQRNANQQRQQVFREQQAMRRPFPTVRQ